MRGNAESTSPLLQTASRRELRGGGVDNKQDPLARTTLLEGQCRAADGLVMLRRPNRGSLVSKGPRGKVASDGSALGEVVFSFAILGWVGI